VNQIIPTKLQKWIGKNLNQIRQWGSRKSLKEIETLFSFKMTGQELFDLVYPEKIMDCDKSRFISFSVGYRACQRNCPCHVKRVSLAVKKTKAQYTQEEQAAINKKRADTNLERYGNENVFQNDSVKEKITQTNLDRYGVENPMQDISIKQKAKLTVQTRYGVDNVMQHSDIIEKNHADRNYDLAATRGMKTKQEKYGNQNYCNIEQIKKTNLKKYGNENPAKNAVVRKKISNNLKKTFVQRYKEKYNIQIDENYVPSTYNNVTCLKCGNSYQARILNGQISRCIVCKPLKYSNIEFEIGEYIESLGFEIQRSDRKILDGKEIDIYVPTLNLGIEVNGLYWHVEECDKDKFYHYNKTKLANEKNVKLIQIFSDEWDKNKDIVKSRLKSITSKNINIYARNTTIQELTVQQARDFLDINHLDGYANSKLKYGLFENDKLLAVMTFSKNRFKNGNEWEIVRFASSVGVNIVGGASKLLSRFIKDVDPAVIITFSNNCWGYTDFYNKIGFELVSRGNPGYFYIDRYNFSERINRMNVQKEKLVAEGFDPTQSEKQIMTGLGLSRVWDCGHSKWILNRR